MGADVVVLTDGATWAHYRDASAEPEIGEQVALSFAVAAPTSAMERFSWRGNDPNSLAKILTLIQTVRSAPISSGTVVDRMGPGRAEIRALIEGLAAALKQRKTDDRTDILFRQWLQMAGVSYGINDVGDAWPSKGSASELMGAELAHALRDATWAESLFVLHSYVALVSKMIGAELLAVGANLPELRPTEWVTLPQEEFVERVSQLESGAITAKLRAPGLLVGDIFGWYSALLADDPALAEAVRRALIVLGELAWARVANSAHGIAGDILRDFYAAVVPRAMRKALGEFFTPQWLAEATIAEALHIAGKTDESATFLDPSCGSGTFLVAALKRELAAQDLLHPDEPGRAAMNAVSHVVGFDINPVAVLMARINIVIALGDRIESLTAVSPRVYEADSILLPDPVMGEHELGESADFRRVPLTIGDIDVPGAMSTLEGLTILRSNVESGIAADRSGEQFKKRLTSDLKKLGLPNGDLPAALAASTRIYERIRSFNEEGLNGVWARIIEQAFAPATLEPVDLVVGNPPWINWKHLPDAWQSRSEPVWRSWGLWATQKGGGGVPLADIATLLVARSLVSYSHEKVVAFLLPESLIIADPGNERLRSCVLKPEKADQVLATGPAVTFRPVSVDDWTKVKPFSPDAANLPIGLFLRANERPRFPIPKRVWQRLTPGTRISPDAHWGQTRTLLSVKTTEIAPVEPNNNSSPWVPSGGIKLLPKGSAETHYIWGQGFHTRGADGLFYVRVLSQSPGPDGLVLIENLPDSGDNTKGEPPRQGAVEAEYLWPLVRGSDVQRFSIDAGETYAILPHDPSDISKILSVDELIERAPNLFDYLEPWIDRMAGRSPYGKLQPTKQHPWGVLGPTEHRGCPVDC